MKTSVSVVSLFLLTACVVVQAAPEYGARQGKLQPTQFLKSYKGFVNDFYRKNDAYRLEYHVGDSARFEQRTDSGEVTGTYAFVAPEGDEYEFKYEADKNGFKVESDALPEAPEETDDVKAAKEAFFEFYEKQRELAGSYENDSEEDSDEDDDDDDDDDNEESSEESTEDEDEEDDEEDENKEEEKGAGRVNRNQQAGQSSRPFGRRASTAVAANKFFNVPYPYRRRS